MINAVNVANVNSVPGLLDVPKINAANKEAASFEQTILKAFDSMNAKQTNMDKLGEQMIVDPESVDVHDITMGMAEASLSLKLAQTIIDRLVKTWNDITTTR